MNKKPVSIETLRKLVPGDETVELPGWQKGQTVAFTLRRTSLRAMVMAGRIPNPLMAAAQRLYEGSGSSAKAPFDQVLKVMDAVVKDAMVSPTLDELSGAGIELTEEQYALIFSYSQKGVEALEAFRKLSGAADNDQSGAVV